MVARSARESAWIPFVFGPEAVAPADLGAGRVDRDKPSAARLYALAVTGRPALTAPVAAHAGGVHDGTDHGVNVVGVDLRHFLTRVSAVTAFATNGDVTDL